MASGARVQNLLSVALEEMPGSPPGHSFAATSVSKHVGAVATGLGLYELPPGNASWPYHFETKEEWLIVLDGELTLRTPEGESVLHAGDVACFPAGATGAHAVRNHSDAPVRYAMPSAEARYGGAAVFPDSGKFQIAGPGFDHRGLLGEPADYWEGEP